MYHVRTLFWHKIWRGVVLHLLNWFKRFNLWETDKILSFCFLARQTDIRMRLQNFLREPMKVAGITVLFASCSNAPKRGKKCDEFKSLYHNILKLLFCGHISFLQRKPPPLEISPHMGKRYAIWRRSRIGSALVRVGQPICSERSAKFSFPHTPKHETRKTKYILVCFVSFLQVWTFHSVWYVRHCTASTVVPKYGPHLVHSTISFFVIFIWHWPPPLPVFFPWSYHTLLFSSDFWILCAIQSINQSIECWIVGIHFDSEIFCLWIYAAETLRDQYNFVLMSTPMISTPGTEPKQAEGWTLAVFLPKRQHTPEDEKKSVLQYVSVQTVKISSWNSDFISWRNGFFIFHRKAPVTKWLWISSNGKRPRWPANEPAKTRPLRILFVLLWSFIPKLTGPSPTEKVLKINRKHEWISTPKNYELFFSKKHKDFFSKTQQFFSKSTMICFQKHNDFFQKSTIIFFQKHNDFFSKRNDFFQKKNFLVKKHNHFFSKKHNHFFQKSTMICFQKHNDFFQKSTIIIFQKHNDFFSKRNDFFEKKYFLVKKHNHFFSKKDDFFQKHNDFFRKKKNFFSKKNVFCKKNTTIFFEKCGFLNIFLSFFMSCIDFFIQRYVFFHVRHGVFAG